MTGQLEASGIPLARFEEVESSLRPATCHRCRSDAVAKRGRFEIIGIRYANLFVENNITPPKRCDFTVRLYRYSTTPLPLYCTAQNEIQNNVNNAHIAH